MRAAGEARTALDTLASFALRCYWGNPAPETRAAVIAAAERLGLPGNRTRAAGDPQLRRPGAAPASGSTPWSKASRPTAPTPTAMWYSGLAAANTWAWDSALPLLDAAVDELRAQGQLGLLTQALTTQAWAAVHLARLPTAVAAASEACRLAVETGQGHWTGANQLAQAVAASAAGDAAAADALAQRTEALYLASGSTSMLGFVQFARGRGAVLNQRYAVGLAYLRRILDPADPVFHPFVGSWGLADLAEAAVALGEPGPARAYLGQLESLAAQTGGPLLLAQAAYAPAAGRRGRPGRAAVPGGAGRGAGQLAGLPGPDAAALRRVAAPPAAGRRVPGAAAGSPGLLRRPRLHPPRRTGAARTAGGRGMEQPPRTAALGRADRAGTADRADGRRRLV